MDAPPARTWLSRVVLWVVFWVVFWADVRDVDASSCRAGEAAAVVAPMTPPVTSASAAPHAAMRVVVIPSMGGNHM